MKSEIRHRIASAVFVAGLALTGAATAAQTSSGHAPAATSYRLAAASADGEAILARIDQFIIAWEGMDIHAVEFMLHNAYTSSAGENKTQYLARLRKEAANTAGRQIHYVWKGSRLTSATRATATIQISYTDQLKNYQNAKYYSNCQLVTFDLIKFTDGKWYLLHEKDTKAACPS